MIDEARLEDQAEAVLVLLNDLYVLEKNEDEERQDFSERIFADFKAATVDDIDTGIEIPGFPARCNELAHNLVETVNAV